MCFIDADNIYCSVIIRLLSNHLPLQIFCISGTTNLKKFAILLGSHLIHFDVNVIGGYIKAIVF